MPDAGLMPLAVLAEEEHLLGDVVRVDHVQVDHRVLLEETRPRGAPVVVRGDRDKLANGDPQFVHAGKAQDVKLQVGGCREELCFQNVELRRETLHKQDKPDLSTYSLNKEGDHTEELGTVLASHDLISEAAAWLRGIVQFYTLN